MKRIIFCAISIIILSSCSYYAPTAQIHDDKNINTEELAEKREDIKQ